MGEPGAQQPVVGAGEEKGMVQPGVGDLIAVGVGDAGDQPVLTQAPQVVGHAPGGGLIGWAAEKFGE